MKEGLNDCVKNSNQTLLWRKWVSDLFYTSQNTSVIKPKKNLNNRKRNVSPTVLGGTIMYVPAQKMFVKAVTSKNRFSNQNKSKKKLPHSVISRKKYWTIAWALPLPDPSRDFLVRLLFTRPFYRLIA
jgi:hypothetical protein